MTLITSFATIENTPDIGEGMIRFRVCVRAAFVLAAMRFKNTIEGQ